MLRYPETYHAWLGHVDFMYHWSRVRDLVLVNTYRSTWRKCLAGNVDDNSARKVWDVLVELPPRGGGLASVWLLLQPAALGVVTFW